MFKFLSFSFLVHLFSLFAAMVVSYTFDILFHVTMVVGQAFAAMVCLVAAVCCGISSLRCEVSDSIIKFIVYAHLVWLMFVLCLEAALTLSNTGIRFQVPINTTFYFTCLLYTAMKFALVYGLSEEDLDNLHRKHREV